ncbi:MAG: maleylacetoacetate isomerase [Byssovorax sp.]
MERCTFYHYWRSSASWRVRWALAIKGVDHQAIGVDLVAGEQSTPEHQARNPIGRVPALVLADGRSLGESVAILEWLDETIPAPALYPEDPWQRARTRQLVEIINAAVQPLQNISVLRRLSPEGPAQREWAAHFNALGLGAYEALLGKIAAEGGGNGPFSIGGALTAADIFLVPQVDSARRFHVDVGRYPRVLAAEEAARATAHAEAARPENQPGGAPG